jgi:hypothetical protein
MVACPNAHFPHRDLAKLGAISAIRCRLIYREELTDVLMDVLMACPNGCPNGKDACPNPL